MPTTDDAATVRSTGSSMPSATKIERSVTIHNSAPLVDEPPPIDWALEDWDFDGH